MDCAREPTSSRGRRIRAPSASMRVCSPDGAAMGRGLVGNRCMFKEVTGISCLDKYSEYGAALQYVSVCAHFPIGVIGTAAAPEAAEEGRLHDACTIVTGAATESFMAEAREA